MRGFQRPWKPRPSAPRGQPIACRGRPTFWHDWPSVRSRTVVAMTANPLAGLSSQETFAALVVADAVGARPEADDVQGRQGAVDVLLTYPDGREAALEVTSQAGAGVQQRNALTRDEVPNPGNWTWHIAIGNVTDLPELLERYARIIPAAEALGIAHPSRLCTRDLPFPDFEWLMESSVTMSGLPTSPASERPESAVDPDPS